MFFAQSSKKLPVDHVLVDVFNIKDPAEYIKWRTFLVNGLTVAAYGKEGESYDLSMRHNFILITRKTPVVPAPIDFTLLSA